MGTAIAELSSLCPPSEDGAIGRAFAELETKLDAWSSALSTTHRHTADCETDTTVANEVSVTDSSGASDCQSEQIPKVSDRSTESAVEPPTNVPEKAKSSKKSRRKKKSKSGMTTGDGSPAQSAPEAATDKSTDAPPDSNELIDRLTDAMSRSDHLDRYDAADTTENAAGKQPADGSQTTDEDVETVLASVDAQVAEQLRARHAATDGEKTLRQVCDEYFEEISDAEQLLASLDPEMAKAIRVQYRLFNGRKSVHQLVRDYEPPKEQPKKKSWWRG